MKAEEEEALVADVAFFLIQNQEELGQTVTNWWMAKDGFHLWFGSRKVTIRMEER